MPSTLPTKEFLTKAFLSLALTLLYFFLLLGAPFWGLGFSLLNLSFLLTLIFQKPALLAKKTNLSFIIASIIISLFFPFRAFFLGYLLNMLMVFWLNILASGTHPHINLNLIIGYPIKTFFLSLMEIPQTINQFSLLISAKLKSQNLAQTLKVGLIGSLIGLPLLVVFLLLFASSDPLFQRYLNNLLPKQFIIAPELIFHTFELIIVFSLFSRLLSKGNLTNPDISLLDNFLKYRSEVAFACLFLILATATFLAIQVQYLFAGEQFLKQMGVMLSEYTRRGYGELLIISSISLTLISVLIHKTETTKQRVRLIAWVFMLEILLVLLSASRRVYLYQDAHGFTLIRVMGVLFSFWLLGVLVIYAARLIRALKENHFTYSLILNTIAIFLLMNVLNIDYIIGWLKQPNLGFGKDYAYIMSLSADGLDGWKETIKFGSEKDNCEEMRVRSLIKLGMAKRRLNIQAKDNWHNLGSWNLSDKKALDYFKENESLLDSLKTRLEKCYNQAPWL